jgi:hypothetical protein
MDAWVHVTRSPQVLMWSDGRVEELLADTASAAEVVAECAQYCPDPRQQAARDLPRQSTIVNGRAARTIEELEALVRPDQHLLVHLLCSQVVMGGAYVCGATGLPDGTTLCEARERRRLQIVVTTDGGRPVYVAVDKPMRTLNVDTGQEARAALYVRLNFRTGVAQVGAWRVVG